VDGTFSGWSRLGLGFLLDLFTKETSHRIGMKRPIDLVELEKRTLLVGGSLVRSTLWSR
jgi:hypothetical protein